MHDRNRRAVAIGLLAVPKIFTNLLENLTTTSEKSYAPRRSARLMMIIIITIIVAHVLQWTKLQHDYPWWGRVSRKRVKKCGNVERLVLIYTIEYFFYRCTSIVNVVYIVPEELPPIGVIL